MRPLLHLLVHALTALLFFTVLNTSGRTAEPRPKRVLIVSTGSRFSPGFSLVDRKLLEALDKMAPGKIEVYGENLDILRFPPERFRRIFTQYLSAKYAKRTPDLVILVFVGSLKIAAGLLHQLFPGTPVLVAGATEEEVRSDEFRNPVRGLAFRANPLATMELMLRLQPEIRRIVVVAGTADVDRQVLARVRGAADSFAGRVDFEFWDSYGMPELRRRVSALPGGTAILFARMFRDGEGRPVISTDAGRAIAEWANVPVYVMTDTILGTGAVGGSVASIDKIGERVGEMARLVLSGTAPESLPFESDVGRVVVFDWRALKRWRISESRLPAASIVRFRPESKWAQYSGYIIGALVIIALQGVMIVDLLVQRRRRRRTEMDLRESQQLMELATGAGDLGLWSRNLEDGRVWASGPMRSLFGFGKDDALRFEDFVARVHPHDRTQMVARVEQAQATGLPFEGEFRVVLPGGEVRWVLSKGRAVVEPDARTARRMGVLLDITDRKRTEERLRESENRFRTMANAAPVMIWMSDTDGLCTFFNSGWLDFTGRTLEQELGNGWADGVHEEDRNHCIQVYHSAFDARQEFTMEYRLRRYDGEYRWVQDNGVPRRGPGEVFLGYIGTAIDITERKRAEQTLRQSEEHYRSLAETASDVIVTADHESTILYINMAVEKVFGYTPADLIGQKLTVLMPQALRQRHLQGMGRYLETGKKLFSWSGVSFTGLHKSGREISLEIAFAESQLGDRRVFTGIMRDITDRIRAEAELQEQRTELAHVARVSTMGELAASLAHELNQPLTAILSNAQAALRFMTSTPTALEEVREILQDIVKDNSRAGEVIRRMRALVKKEALDFAALDLASLIRDVVALLHSDAILQNVRISFELDDHLPLGWGDRVQLQQVVLNLLLNAFDAMKECPASEREVRLQAEPVGAKFIAVAVRDRGTGLSGDKLDKIFQPFYTSKRDGLGMGLSICRSIIEAHGGRLWAENNAHRGATFHFTLPISGSEGHEQRAMTRINESPG